MDFHSFSPSYLRRKGVFPFILDQFMYKYEVIPMCTISSIIRSGIYSREESAIIMGNMSIDDELTPGHVRAFAGMKVDLNRKTDDGETLYHYAIKHRKLKLIQTLQECGGDIHTLNDSGLKAMHYSGLIDDKRYINFFINRGFDINDQGESSKTPLMFAAFADNPTIVKHILNLGGNPYIADLEANSMTPLHIAIEGGSYRSLRAMLKAGIDPNTTAEDNVTPLHWAAFREDAEAVKILLAFKANKEAFTNGGETAWDLASEELREEVPELEPSDS